MNLQGVERDIRAIPGNGGALEELYRLLESGEAIGLVGAGASAGLWPLWNQFLQGFVECSLKGGKIKNEEAEFFWKEASQTPLETAQQLRNKVGDPFYFEYLQETFRDKPSPQTRGAYTPAHLALMQLPIHNYLTLNYDAGLTNARTALYPKATTSYYFWDQDEARRIRDRNYKRQVLHAHGRYDRADSIILALDDYRRAYTNRPFVRLLEDIFAFENLLIVGFGMSDPYIKQLFNNISADYKKTPLHHIALVGLDDKDLRVTHLLRERVAIVYGAHILFYPARNNHEALTEWLMMLARKYAEAAGSQTAEEIHPLSTPPELKEALSDKYVHRPTDDANFKGRADDFAMLNRWGNDPATRTIAITGIGGQGKTALVGRWLKNERSPELAQIPVFYWSFYEDLDVGKFLERVVEFCVPIVGTSGKQEIEPLSFILGVAQQARLLVVLDGLEVLQAEAGIPAHGRINHPLLEQLLQQWLRYQHQSLMILTSRFQFPDLARYSGVGLHHMNLVRLSILDAIALLKKLDVRGKEHVLERYVESLHGHPLALRVLASTVKRCCFGDLSQFEGEHILTAASGQDKLSLKLEHLLGFYEKQLKDGQKELLAIISLFKRPVEIKSFVMLLGSMKSLENTPLAKANAAQIEKQLDLLVGDFLVEKTREGITTHPVIRDYFREGHKIVGSRREVADFLKNRPGSQRPQNIGQVRDKVEAIQLLCDEGDFMAADDLYRSRLSKGGFGFNVFKNLPALAEGIECTQAFVGNPIRQEKAKRTLGGSYLGFYIDEASLMEFFLGNLGKALHWRNTCLRLRIGHRPPGMDSKVCDFIEISRIEATSGNLRQALSTVSDALTSHAGGKDPMDLCLGFSKRAYHEFLLGNVSQAYLNFEIALHHQPQPAISDERFLYSMRGIEHAEFLMRIKALKRSKHINRCNLDLCKRNGWNDKLALCYLLRGWSRVLSHDFLGAGYWLEQADTILRSSSWLEQICRLDWVWALLSEARRDYRKGLQRVNDTLPTCADKGFRLWQADLIVLRGRLRLHEFQKENQNDIDLEEKAGDDGHEALRIAEQTGYIWAKVEALELLGSYHESRNERDLAARYANEAASLKTRLFLTEEQMNELEAQARKEFEKQTATWGNKS